MLPVPVLDDEQFGQIVEYARSMIPRVSPEWTDFNAHDPGITFLELFAFLKESQQYHLDQIGPRNQQKFLKLLGVRPRGTSAARTRAMVSGSTQWLPSGVRFQAGIIPFETAEPMVQTGGRLQDGFVWDGHRRMAFSAADSGRSGKLQLQVLPLEARDDCGWYLRFDGPWQADDTLELYLWIRQDWQVRRNPPGKHFTPLVQLKWECLTQKGWERMMVSEDETHGLLFSGNVRLESIGAPVVTESPQPGAALEPGCWIRVRPVQGCYDVPPVVTGISERMVPLVQRETIAQCLATELREGNLWAEGMIPATGEFALFTQEPDGVWQERSGVRRMLQGELVRFYLPGRKTAPALLLSWREDFGPRRMLGQGSGFPDQSYELGRTGQLKDSFQLMVEEPDRPGDWCLWQRVEDFDASGPEDRHYILEEQTGVVRFGDCIRGMAPEGAILIAGQAVSLGAGGNVKAGSIRKLHPEDAATLELRAEEILVNNPDNAFGGRAPESYEDCFRRCRLELRRTQRAVTYGDYELLVRQTPGLMISNCKAIGVQELPRPDGSLDEGCVTVVVEPYAEGREGHLSPGYEKNILDHLESRRMLGTKVMLLSPEYVSITIYAEIQSQPHYVDARARIQSAVEEYFRQGWEFGAPVRYSTLYGIMDTLDCVRRVVSLTIDAQGRGISRGTNGDVILPHNGLAVLTGAGYQVRPAE